MASKLDQSIITADARQGKVVSTSSLLANISALENVFIISLSFMNSFIERYKLLEIKRNRV